MSSAQPNYRAGAVRLEEKVATLAPECVAVLGLSAYRTAWRRPTATIGPQAERLAGSRLWLLPNPSGLQARYQLEEMATFFTDLHDATFGAD